jgi:hypothetical protein
VALTFVLGGCSLGYGSSSTASAVVSPTPLHTASTAGSSHRAAAPASVYTSRNGAHQLALALQVRHGACALLPVFDTLRQGTGRYSDVESAIQMQLYGSAPADDKDAIAFFHSAQTALSRIDPPASLTQVQLLLQSATADFLSVSENLRPELAKNNLQALPTHRSAYTRGMTLFHKASAALRLEETKAGLPTGNLCPGYTPPSQNVFDTSELDFTRGLSSRKVAPALARTEPPAAPRSLAVAATPVTRVIYITRPAIVARPIHRTTHPTSHASHASPSSRATYSAPMPEPAPARSTPAPVLKDPHPALLSKYMRGQDVGLTHLLDASDALSAALRDLQHNLLSDAEMQLRAARRALFGEKARLSKQRPPTADLRLVRDREHRAIKAYVNAYGYAVRALTAERMSGLPTPHAFGNAPVIEFESAAPGYLKAARNGMQRAGVRWHKARRLLHSLHP